MKHLLVLFVLLTSSQVSAYWSNSGSGSHLNAYQRISSRIDTEITFHCKNLTLQQTNACYRLYQAYNRQAVSDMEGFAAGLQNYSRDGIGSIKLDTSYQSHFQISKNQP